MAIVPDSSKRAATSPSDGQPTGEQDNQLFWLDEQQFGKSGSPRDLPNGLQFDAAERERHRIYASLVMALTYHFWCGNRFGVGFDYRLNPPVDRANGVRGDFLSDTYLGHNIAAVATDHLGHVIDFDFNHNAAFASSAEHAENRLVRRLFRIANANPGTFEISEPVKQRQAGVRPNSHKLNLVTLYTSLESCGQCSGSMAMGSIKQVVYLQPDPGAYLIGNIMFRLGMTRSSASGNPISHSPLPIAGSQIGFTPYAELEKAYDAFTSRPFTDQFCPDVEGVLPEDKEKAEERKDKSLSSFLCTKAAWEIYRKEAYTFELRGKLATGDLSPDALTDEDRARLGAAIPLEYPDGTPRWQPKDPNQPTPRPEFLTNLQCLQEAYTFLKRARARGQRGIARGG